MLVKILPKSFCLIFARKICSQYDLYVFVCEKQEELRA